MVTLFVLYGTEKHSVLLFCNFWTFSVFSTLENDTVLLLHCFVRHSVCTFHFIEALFLHCTI